MSSPHWSIRPHPPKKPKEFTTNIQISNLLFVLLSETIEQLNSMLQEFEQICQPVGLFININKTKVMAHENQTVLLGTKKIDYVEQYIYISTD